MVYASLNSYTDIALGEDKMFSENWQDTYRLERSLLPVPDPSAGTSQTICRQRVSGEVSLVCPKNHSLR
jgi:hypothetical protein